MASFPVLRDIPVINYGAQTRAALDRFDAEHEARNAEEVRFAAEQTRRVRLELEAKKTPLQRAGDRLDTAAMALRYLASDCPTIDEASFGAAELELEQARAEYLGLLCQASGESAADLIRRAAA